ncbi:MAG: argininosuccinate lyase, partial [Bacteroidota bacterium]
MKLWQTEQQLNQDIEAFTIGRDRELDLLLAPFDVQGSLAHIQMLESVGLLEKKELAPLQKELQSIYADTQNGQFEIEEGVEDVHSQIEWMLTQRLGVVGKKIHSGRSRNDQVLVDLRLFFRAEIRKIAQASQQLFESLMAQSQRYETVLMPGYTHMQIAMVSSFGMWLGAYAESLTEDMLQLHAAYRIINQNPLGSAAGYGSSMPLNRAMTTQLLGFDELCYNSMHAQMGRGKTELFLSFSIAAIAQTLNKLAMDVCLFSSQNFAFISLPESLTTGSSIMPHKKNPDVFELIRGRCNQLLALPQQIGMLCSNLPSGYHRDYQLLKEVIFPALQQLKDCLKMTQLGIEQLSINTQILDDPKYRYLYSVELVNEEVIKGLP